MKIQRRAADIKRTQKYTLNTTADRGVSILSIVNSIALAKRAKQANIEAEQAISLAYKAEIARTRLIAEAMYKSGYALRCSYESAIKQIKGSSVIIINKIKTQFKIKQD